MCGTLVSTHSVKVNNGTARVQIPIVSVVRYCCFQDTYIVENYIVVLLLIDFVCRNARRKNVVRAHRHSRARQHIHTYRVFGIVDCLVKDGLASVCTTWDLPACRLVCALHSLLIDSRFSNDLFSTRFTVTANEIKPHFLSLKNICCIVIHYGRVSLLDQL